MGAYAADEAAPILGNLLVGVVSILAAFILYGLRFLVVDVFGYMLHQLARIIDSVVPFANPASDAVDFIVNGIGNHLASAALACEGAGVRWLLAFWHLTLQLAFALEHFAQETSVALQLLRDVSIPRLIREATGGAEAAYATLRGLVGHARTEALHGINEAVGAAELRLHGIDELLSHELAQAEHAVTVTLPHEIAAAGADVHGWAEGRLHGIDELLAKRWAQVVELTGAAAIVAIIAREFPLLRCRNVNSLGRKLCGLPTRWLEDLLGGVVAVLVVTELCNVGRVAQVAAQDVILPAAELWLLAEPYVCLGGGGDYPSGYVEPPALHRATLASAL